MRPSAVHLRIIEDTGRVRERYGLLLAGGYALQAHGCADRRADDLCFVTAHRAPITEPAAAMAAALRERGLSAEPEAGGPRMARVLVTDEIAGWSCAVELSREDLRDAPLDAGVCLVVGLDDAVGLAVRALHDRGLPRDFIDVAAAGDRYGFRDLERLGARHADEWRTEELVQRLETVDQLADEAFTRYGVDEERITAIRRFAYAWVEEIKLRRVEDGDIEFGMDVPEVD
mgnify:CR=1 FL=1